LKLYRGKLSYFSITEATTPAGCSFQPTMDRIPGNSLDPSDGGLIQTLDTEKGFIRWRAGAGDDNKVFGLSSRTSCRKSRTVAATLSPSCLVEAMSKDLSEIVSPCGQRLFGQTETLHDWLDLVDVRTDGVKLSLKLYYARELQLD
jgi:hypothetical protein